MTPQNDAPWWDPDARAAEETPQPATPPEPESQPENGSAPRRMSLRKTICDWISANHHTRSTCSLAWSLPLAFFAFGFWRTLLVALCVWHRLHSRQLARRQSAPLGAYPPFL